MRTHFSQLTLKINDIIQKHLLTTYHRHKWGHIYWINRHCSWYLQRSQGSGLSIYVFIYSVPTTFHCWGCYACKPALRCFLCS